MNHHIANASMATREKSLTTTSQSKIPRVAPRRLGVLITRFPDQTSISMWRVLQALRELQCEVEVLSTRRPEAVLECHEQLKKESANAFYSWPPKLTLALRCFMQRPFAIANVLRYLATLNESRLTEKLRLLPVVVSGAALAEHARRVGLEHVLVHSCANAAHLINFSKLMGGPPFSLRLGGDLAVYGKDHGSKIAAASFMVPAANVNAQEIADKHGYPAERTIATALGVDTRRFTPCNVQPHKESVTPTKSLKVVTVARLNRAKGHQHAIEALALLKSRSIDVQYVVGGSGPAETDLREQVASLGVSDRVTFAGPLDESQVIEVLRRSDVFVLPSVGRGEASPVAVIEAMSCGVPVVSTIIGGTPDMITDGIEGFLVPQADSHAIAAAIEQLAIDTDKRFEMASASRRRAVNEFDCRQVARRIIEAIDTWSE